MYYCYYMAIEQNNSKQHPLSIVINEAVKIFNDLGFEVATGPELEDEWHNFDALNVPKDHPARDMQDTFWIKGRKILSKMGVNHLSRLLFPEKFLETRLLMLIMKCSFII
ncbi:MAG: Phenylalanine-tRNA ligase alpha subunit [Candidatus Nomurabacteria bacterium GW2011_GWB1_37_5]|uniref:Phenylalanine-tRNA ligase alpha subunit n=1 Tax=Candidatus Nomurabacteria bacterium GW2011_GWB1_37_5 TaxID=1618742 RepID=A0A0G0JD81_9BACT|nr:MAG: Phenylalanine-tRNA ligase alpha subunit [Candidatus Nomurabacteria bacterium GW2011_GWB1_37_5]